MKSTYEDTVELTLNTSHNSGSETAADSSTFQPPSQRIKYASFAEIIVCIPYESKYQSPFQQTGIFSTFAVNDKNIQLNWSMGVQISWTVEVAGTPSAWTGSVKPTQLLTFPRKWTQEIGSCFPFLFFPFPLFFSCWHLKHMFLCTHGCCPHHPQQWIRSLHDLRKRHHVTDLFSIQKWFARKAKLSEL